MTKTLDMYAVGERIRLAFEADPSKTRSELARRLGVANSAISELQKGRRQLKAHEVPIVEEYLGISVLGEGVPSGRKGVREHGSMAMGDGVLVPRSELPSEVEQFFARQFRAKPLEIWQISTDLIAGAGYLPGDYVAVDTSILCRPRDIVLAERRESVGTDPHFLFRAYVPPFLLAATPGTMPESPLIVDDNQIIIRGVVVASVRIK